MRELRESIIDGSLPQFVAAFLQVRPAVSSAVSAAVSPPFLHRFSAVFVHSILARSYLHPQRMYPTGEVPPWAAEALTIAGIPTSTVATAGEGPMIHQAQCAAFSVLLFQCALFSVPHHSVPSFSALFQCPPSVPRHFGAIFQCPLSVCPAPFSALFQCHSVPQGRADPRGVPRSNCRRRRDSRRRRRRRRGRPAEEGHRPAPQIHRVALEAAGNPGLCAEGPAGQGELGPEHSGMRPGPSLLKRLLKWEGCFVHVLLAMAIANMANGQQTWTLSVAHEIN